MMATKAVTKSKNLKAASTTSNFSILDLYSGGDPEGFTASACVGMMVSKDDIADRKLIYSSFASRKYRLSESEFLIPTPWSDESNNEKRAKRWREEFEWKRSFFEINFTFGINAFDLDKRTDVMKDTVSQKNVCEEEVSLNNNIGKQIGDFVDMLSEAVEKMMDANVPDEIDGAKGEHVPNHVVKKGNLEFLICKEVANPGVNELVDK
nr:hypothetical protein [Tanacetum cinerariifolium]